ncbi:MAG: hypothetical protein LBM13_05565 [Candidatus Ancillula sp.]|nr:hypothetical protein [Candidatus Ancillula sp.]
MDSVEDEVEYFQEVDNAVDEGFTYDPLIQYAKVNALDQLHPNIKPLVSLTKMPKDPWYYALFRPWWKGLLWLLLLILLLVGARSCSEDSKTTSNSDWSGMSTYSPSGDSDESQTNDSSKEGTEWTSSEHQQESGESWSGLGLSNIDDVVKNVKFSDYGEFLFRHTMPVIVPENKFGSEHYCGSDSDSEGMNGVLGCYIPEPTKNVKTELGESTQQVNDQDFIFIRSFNDKSLVKEMYVVAAHETLHAGFEAMKWRYPDTLAESIIPALYDYYENNSDLQDRMKPYLDSGMSDKIIDGKYDIDFVNELHSIIPTEYGAKQNLPVRLENYYKMYFEDRKQIARTHQNIRCYIGDLICW